MLISSTAMGVEEDVDDVATRGDVAPRADIDALRTERAQPVPPDDAGKVEFHRRLVLTAIDKGLLGVGIAIATLLFGARLEAVKRADAQVLELTRVRVAEASAFYQSTAEGLVEHNLYVRHMGDLFGVGASREELIAARASYESSMEKRRLTQKDPVWSDASLRRALMDYDLACRAYENMNGHLRINCVIDKMGAEAMNGAELTALWQECQATCGPSASEEKLRGAMAGMAIRLQRAIDEYVATTTERPSIWSF